MFVELINISIAFQLLKSDHRCNSLRQRLISGNIDPNTCAEACKEEPGCKYFTISDVDCYWDKAGGRSCPEGWSSVVGWYFYELEGNFS